MKKIYIALLALTLGLVLASCEDENYDIHTTPLLNDSSVVTGSADVTATSALLNGSVDGLDKMDPSSYALGFFYGETQDNLSESTTAAAQGSGAFAATLSGLTNNTTLYYQAYVRLQGKVYYKGEVKSFATSNARVTTKAAEAIDHVSAKLGGSLTDYPEEATCGIVISTSSEVEAVRNGLIIENNSLEGVFSITRSGLLPATKYYYAAYINLGTGIIYGDVASFTTKSYEFDLDNDLVDLGLSVRWARFNIGAKAENDLGGLFAFGDLTGCNNSIDAGDYAAADVYRTAADLAFQAYQGRATMPTAADFEELFQLCSKEWTEQDGVSGYKLTGPNGNSIFLPAAGSRIANTVENEGIEGFYLTGSVNPTNPQFAISYQFNAGMNSKTTTAAYEAMAVRAVSTAKSVPFDRSLLLGKWYLDNGQSGQQLVFEGPFTQWGETDNWNTVSNGQPNIEQQIHWEMGTGNGWVGYTYGVDYGYMEFLEDGTVNIHRLDDDGNVTDESGTYTIDEANKVIDIDINVLCANTWVAVKSGKLNILSLTKEGLQIAIRNNDGYAYSLNYYSEAKAAAAAKLPVSLLCVGADWNGTWGTVVNQLDPNELAGKHSFFYEGACSGAMVFTLDVQGLIAKYPNAFVRIDEMKCDGVAIPFNANYFSYGDIENNGNYRIELFNIWGVGAADGNVVNSPFSAAEQVGSDPAFNFSESLEVTYTVFTDTDGAGSYTPNLITINPSWGGTWGFNTGAAFEVKYENFRYSLVSPAINIKYESGDHADGSIMTFLQVDNLFNLFPGTHATLDQLYLDGEEVSFDRKMVIDSSDGGAYRLELWNCYGATKDAGCAFGTPEGDVIKGLAFGSSMEVNCTFHSLFAVPAW